ncbi:type II secretion system protein GspC [Echinimonas agarilytica]|uniref:Type II secretion system protein GspC n=1 Tax=Echinimonas agarilytica TaxID=1215918 RepID=A0AA41W827_9GAMM|nr:type II secretion system protein GspC [Echinimonas agarilytica]MCM2680895.1 type II secretion system protein GspC [Echinimonas agarilytica]
MTWEAKTKAWLSAIPVAKVRLAMTAVLVVLIAYLLAELTGILLPNADSKGEWIPPQKASAQKAEELDVSALQAMSLFGESKPAEQVEIVEVQDAPETKLNLKLTGVVATMDPEIGLAVIDSKGSQATYSVDDRIEGTRASIKNIYPDRVIISNSGVLETLMLDDEYLQDNFPKKATQRATTKRATARTVNPKLKAALASVGDPSMSPADKVAKLTDYIKISPVREGTDFKGFRVNPGVDREIFESAGLKPGDLAVALNGYDLTDLSQTAAVMQELETMSDLALTVERDGQLYEFLFELPAL